MNKKRIFRFFKALARDYFIFFVMVSFAVTCCTALFAYSFARTYGLSFDGDNLGVPAKLTFVMVLVVSLLFAVVDKLRRRTTVERHTKKIKDVSEKIMEGDFSARIPPIRGGDGGSGMKEVIDCFNKMAEELSGIESLRSDLIANVSHELKTPLTVIGNYARMLEDPDLTEEERKNYIKSITESTKKLSELITNILRLNKLENSSIPLNVKNYDLSEQLCGCVIDHEELLERKELSIECDIEDGIIINADPEMMSLIWNNLVSNAIKFTDKGGSIFVSLSAEGDFATVTVRDTGCGISPEVGEHIFEKFYQGDRSRASEGNGLGLPLVKRVLDLADGEISVESELSRGSSFAVKIRREQNGEI